MNKKGFTLIELIAAIALLAIIAVIAFVSVSKVITKNKIENCKTLVKNITVAAAEYAGDNRYKSTFINRITSNELLITADELVNNNYLNGEIIDPYDKSTIEANAISVHMYFNSDYTIKYITVDSPEVLNKCNLEQNQGATIPDNPTYVDDGSDKTPPVISYSLSSGTYKGFQQLTVTVTDSESGIDYMVVEVYEDNKLVSAKSATKITASSYQVTLDSYHEWKVLTKAYDKAGNKSNQMPQTDDGRYYQEYEIIGKPIYIYYHQNGGTISGKCAVGAAAAQTCNEYNGWASNGTTYAYQICASDTECNLWNYNNSNYMNIERSGYGTIANQEWKADRTGTILSQNNNYTYEKLKESIYADKDEYYELNLRVNWIISAEITCTNKDYNGSLQTIASCSGGTVNNARQTNAGDYTITCTGDSNHSNANSKICSINKVNAEITCENKTYNANVQTIASCSGGTVRNARQTNAGDYTITCTGDSNHLDAKSKKCTIKKYVYCCQPNVVCEGPGHCFEQCLKYCSLG